MFKITGNLKEFERGLNDVARRQIPYATALTVNDVLADVKRNWEKRLRRSIDRPTPFTLKAFAIKRASKRRLSGTVFAKDVQDDYLRWLEDGGERQPQRKAILVPVGQRLNKYGNMPRGAVGRTLASGKTFSGKPKGHAAGGIYQRVGKGRNARLKLLVHYASGAGYRPRLDLVSGAMKTATARFPRALIKAMRRAMNSAR